jgi:hypothetical protein
MLNLEGVTLSTLYVPWDKNKISQDDLQDGERNKNIDNGVEQTIKAIYTCLNFAKFDSVNRKVENCLEMVFFVKNLV